MQYCGMQVEGISIQLTDTTVVNYINELKAEYERQIQELKNQFIELEEKYKLLIYQKYMRRAEQLPVDEKQQLLFTPEVEPVEAAPCEEEEEKTEVKSHTRKKPGRKPINPNIPRVEKIIDIPEEEKKCGCGADLTRIGEETSEEVHIEAPRIYVEKTIRPKYACRSCEGTEDEEKPTVRIAPVAPSIIPRSIASPSLLSTIFTHKFEDHLPYNRQEKQFERIGVAISRQDMSNWQQFVYKVLAPLFMLFKKIVKSGPVIQLDDYRNIYIIETKQRKAA